MVREVASRHALSVSAAGTVLGNGFSKDFPKIHKLPREKHGVSSKSGIFLTCYFKSAYHALDFTAKCGENRAT